MADAIVIQPKNAESSSFSHSPHVTPSLNIKHHISILHSCDGYVWLLAWLHLELSNTQMIRHTCDVWYFFLIKSFDVSRATSHLDLWGGKIHLYSEPNLLLAAYREDMEEENLLFLCLPACSQQGHFFTGIGSLLLWDVGLDEAQLRHPAL